MLAEQTIDTTAWWPIELETKPDFDVAMKRIYAWHQQEIIDRAPVRFIAHNAAFNVDSTQRRSPVEWKQIWFEVEPRVESFEKSIVGRIFHGETFPMFDPNLGPDIYAAFYGAELTFGEVTSWAHPVIKSWDDMELLNLDMHNDYFKKIEELMTGALERCAGQYLVGYTDLHPSEDCAMAWRGSQQLCVDLYDSPAQVKQLIDIASADFQMIFDHFDAMLKARGQPSMCWIGIPSFGKFHVPSCDFSAMISPDFFAEFSLPILQQEVKPMTDVVYHVDGLGVANHLDHILSVPEIDGIQWVQDPNRQAIMQWVPLIKKVLAAGKSIIVDLQPRELEDFIAAMDSPKGIFLWIGTEDEAEQLAPRSVAPKGHLRRQESPVTLLPEDSSLVPRSERHIRTCHIFPDDAVEKKSNVNDIWIEIMKKENLTASLFAVCINNSEYSASLELHKIYRVIPDDEAANEGDIRVIDESGEDYLYPAEWFVLVELPDAVERSVLQVA